MENIPVMEWRMADRRLPQAEGLQDWRGFAG
jgi:hypothetical protein